MDILNEENVNNFLNENSVSPTIILIAVGLADLNEKNYKRIAYTNYVYPMVFIEKSLIKYKTQDKLNTIIVISSVAGDR